MEMTEKIALCKQCKQRAFNPSKGIVCGITNEKPTFETACKDFTRDESIKERIPLTIRASDKEGRGGCLTALLVLIIIGATISILFSLFAIASYNRGMHYYVPIQYFFSSILVGGLSLAGAILMFQWKKLGVYIYGAAIFLNITTQVLRPRFESIQLVGIIIGLIILFAVIAPKWDNFK